MFIINGCSSISHAVCREALLVFAVGNDWARDGEWEGVLLAGNRIVVDTLKPRLGQENVMLKRSEGQITHEESLDDIE